MKYEVVNVIEGMLKDRKTVNGKEETTWNILVNNKVFSRAVPVSRTAKAFYEEDWVTILFDQIEFIKEFLATSVRMGLGIPPLNKEGSLTAMAVYNAAMAASDIEAGQISIPSKFDCIQEFYKLLMQSQEPKKKSCMQDFYKFLMQ